MLLASNKGRPASACCRRAVSSCYYALFHCLAAECANLLIGGSGSDRSEGAWHQVYRSLEHGPAKSRCMDSALMKRFPKEIEDFGNTFVTLQRKRHQADYDPFVRFAKSSVEADVLLAQEAIRKFQSAAVKHRRAFCAYVLLKKREPN